MDIDIFEEKFGKYFTNKRGLYVIRPGTNIQASNIHSVLKAQKDKGKDFSKNLQLGYPLYKIGLAGLPGSKTGLLGRLKDYQTGYPNGFQVVCILIKTEETIRVSETKIFDFLETEKVMYRRVGKATQSSSGRTEWTGATLTVFLKILYEHHKKSRSNQGFVWRFTKDDAILQNTAQAGKKLRSVDMSKIRHKPFSKNTNS